MPGPRNRVSPARRATGIARILLAVTASAGAANRAAVAQQPSAPDSATHAHSHAVQPEGGGGLQATWGEWSVAGHALLTLNARWDPPPRGRRELFGTNMAGASFSRSLGAGRLDLSIMTSLEPLMGPDGYSLLLQTGETADGLDPMIDRQHPHDALMAVGASYTFPLPRGAWGRLYAAPVGSPALGPVPFMHRRSAGGNPTVPISHHFLDATHISHGVVTVGFGNDWVTLEGSVFNGREPDRHRWVPDRPAWNSYSVRLVVTPRDGWSVQGSIGELSEPERLHPGIDLQRMTVSVSHELERGPLSAATTIAWGRNTWRDALLIIGAPSPSLEVRPLFHVTGATHDHSSIVYMPQLVHSAWLAEGSLSAWGFEAFGRYEQARKNELFPSSDPRHLDLYDIAKLEVGLLRYLDLGRTWNAAVGGSLGVHRLERALQPLYGERPRSFMLFVRLDLG